MTFRTIIVLAALGTAVLPVEAQCKPDTLGGDSQWQRRLGMFYEQHKNYHAALTCFRLSAEQGDVNSQVVLGEMYEEGKGVLQDFASAFECYMKAALQSEHPPSCGSVSHAREKIAMMYLLGEGVKVNHIEAYKWYVLADQLDEASHVMEQLSVADVVEAQRRLDLWNAEHPQVSTCE